jgi:hypothetical protein
MRDPESRSGLGATMGLGSAFIVAPLLSWLFQGG